VCFQDQVPLTTTNWSSSVSIPKFDPTLGDLVSISFTLSGNIQGTPGAMLMGPAGFFEMKDGVIRALRHVHMHPTDADFYSVKHGDNMKLKIGGDCGIVLDKVLCRVDKLFKLEVHIDTDEGNACNLQPNTPCELVK
jgi:putative phosphotransacetylase